VATKKHARVFEYVPKAVLKRMLLSYAETHRCRCVLYDLEPSTGGTRPEGLALADRLINGSPRAAFCEKVRSTKMGQMRCRACDSMWASLVLLAHRRGPKVVAPELERLLGRNPSDEETIVNKVLCRNDKAAPPYLAYICHAGVVDIVAPILVRNEPLAMMYAGQRRLAGKIELNMLRHLETLADEIGVATSEMISLYLALDETSETKTAAAAHQLAETAAVLSELGDRAFRFREVSRTAAPIAAEEEYEQALDGIVKAAQEVSGSQRATLWAYSRERQELIRQRTVGLPPRQIKNLDRTKRLGEPVVGRVAEKQEPVEIRNVSEAPQIKWDQYQGGMLSEYAVPCQTGHAKEDLFGVLSVKRREPGPFPLDVQENLQLLGLHAAVAMKNARRTQDLKEALQTQRRFLSLASHQLIGPLSAIVQVTSEDGPLRKWAAAGVLEHPRLPEIIGLIDERAQVAMARARDILALSEGKSYEVNDSICSVLDIVEGAERLLLPMIAEKRVHIVKSGLEKLPPVRVDCERLKDLAIRNVLENAVRFSGKGQTVEIRGSSGQYGVRLRIKDMGPGIPPKLRERIFEPHVTGKRKGSRLGLGLAAARIIMKAHGGHIWVGQPVGQYSTAIVIQIPPERIVRK